MQRVCITLDIYFYWDTITHPCLVYPKLGHECVSIPHFIWTQLHVYALHSMLGYLIFVSNWGFVLTIKFSWDIQTCIDIDSAPLHTGAHFIGARMICTDHSNFYQAWNVILALTFSVLKGGDAWIVSGVLVAFVLRTSMTVGWKPY